MFLLIRMVGLYKFFWHFIIFGHSVLTQSILQCLTAFNVVVQETWETTVNRHSQKLQVSLWLSSAQQLAKYKFLSYFPAFGLVYHVLVHLWAWTPAYFYSQCTILDLRFSHAIFFFHAFFFLWYVEWLQWWFTKLELVRCQ